MNQEEFIKLESKFEKSCFLNKIYSTWLLGLYMRGLKREITVSDLCKSPPSDDAKCLADTLERNWNQELKRVKPSFTRATVKSFGASMLLTFASFIFAECFLRSVQPLMLAAVIRFFANPDPEDYLWACLNAAGVVGASFIFILCHHPASYNSFRVAMKIRVAWCTLMYRKALRLHNSAFSQTTIGQILNLMSNDVNRLDEFMATSIYAIVAPIQTVICITILYSYLGYYCFIGLIILALFIPLNSLTGRIFQQVRTRVAALSDTRIRIVNEIIKGMRVIKMYAWEKHFSLLISEARKREMVKIRHAILLRAMNISISVVSPRIILFAIFITYVIQGNTLNADKVFVTMTIINTISNNMTTHFSNSVSLFSELLVASKRIQRFLLLEEMKPVSSHYRKVPTGSQLTEPAIEIKELDVKWNRNQEQLSLHSLNLSVKKGELLAVIGSVGSGKSTFLMSLMNELEIESGSIVVNGRIAYASQEPWSFNSSVADNILFGTSWDAKKYNEVVHVCAMRKDFKQFPFGDKTLVGERGVSLSGGQKARLTLARALYNDADVYLLDDPLSAVDSEVANHIFDECIANYLRSKTVILVTHQIQFLKKASKILVLQDGKQLAFGTYDEIINSGIDLVSLIQKIDSDKEKEAKQQRGLDSVSTSRTTSVLSVLSEISSDGDLDDDTPQVSAEEKSSGSVNSKVYWHYVKAGAGPVLMIAMIISSLVSQALFNYTDIWLSNWTNREDGKQRNGTSSVVDETHNSIIYATLIVTQFLGMIIRTGTFFAMCIYASINLHNRIFYRLMRAPISFFDHNPTGRILNRFTKDVGIVDEQLPRSAYDLNWIVTQVIGTMIVVAISQWYLIFPALIMIALILLVRAAYIRTARDVKRYEGMARSPMYNHMTMTLSGLATIRAFEAQPLFAQQYVRHQNDHTAIHFHCFASARLLGICMDLICVAYIGCVALFLMAFYHGIQSGTAGLAFSVSLGLTGITQWGVRQSAEVENQMTSVERIIEYASLEQEASLTSTFQFPPNWPSKGHISFDHVFLTYDNSPTPVLKDLTFEIRGGEKVGIVGRTGAGKSSILTALFRMVEVQGKIVIDGVDCGAIGLHELRSKMSIIPQEPVAFIGSLRKNIDPFDEHQDEELWSALEKVQLKSAVMEMPGKLEYQLSESGGNLSVGQRQLICLARALLRHNRILVLDEATANVDHRTDSLIQQTIRNNFAQCTVITIAHRLNTIIDSDRILVLDAGQVLQYDTPYRLLQDHNGIFYNLVQQTGPLMSARLMAAAAESANLTNY